MSKAVTDNQAKRAKLNDAAKQYYYSKLTVNRAKALKRYHQKMSTKDGRAKLREYQRKYRAKNRDKLRQYNTEFQRKYRAQFKAKQSQSTQAKTDSSQALKPISADEYNSGFIIRK